MLHFTAVTSVVVLWRPTPRGEPGEEGDRTGQIVLVKTHRGQTEFFSEEDASASSEAAASSAADPIATAAAAPSPLAGVLPVAQPAGGGSQEGELLADAGGFTQIGRPSRSTSGAKAKTSVFGAEGEGSKFVYVFDRSSSMSGYSGRPLAAAKSELYASLGNLGSVHQFQLIFYNERPQVLNPYKPQPPRLMFGDDQSKKLASRFIAGIEARGGTRHMDALKLALGMRPDVMFFLTDALEPPLSPSQLKEVARLNGRVGATIHSIHFGSGPAVGGVNFLHRLAEQSGGRYVYVDVTKLPFR
jgi:hypothetical protein